jgi:hypothetical protein
VELDLGMLFSRVCFHYGLSYRDCMTLPMKTFWMLNRNISRVLAEQDLRAFQLAVSTQNGEAASALHTKLLSEFDNPYRMDQEAEVAEVIEEQRDEAGFAQLKLM